MKECRHDLMCDEWPSVFHALGSVYLFAKWASPTILLVSQGPWVDEKSLKRKWRNEEFFPYCLFISLGNKCAIELPAGGGAPGNVFERAEPFLTSSEQFFLLP